MVHVDRVRPEGAGVSGAQGDWPVEERQEERKREQPQTMRRLIKLRNDNTAAPFPRPPAGSLAPVGAHSPSVSDYPR